MRGRTGSCQSAITAATSSVCFKLHGRTKGSGEREATNQMLASKEIDCPLANSCTCRPSGKPLVLAFAFLRVELDIVHI